MCPVKILIRLREYMNLCWAHMSEGTFSDVAAHSYKSKSPYQIVWCGLGGLVVSALDFQASRDDFQTISTSSSYSTCRGLSIKWTGRRLVTDSGIKCASMIHEIKAVQMYITIAAVSLCPGCLVVLKIRTTRLCGFAVCIKPKDQETKRQTGKKMINADNRIFFYFK